MKFPVITIDASKEKAEFDALVKLHAPFGLTPCEPLEVRLHGKQLLLLGEWESPDYHYAAVREIGAKNTDYHLIDPRYIK